MINVNAQIVRCVIGTQRCVHVLAEHVKQIRVPVHVGHVIKILVRVHVAPAVSHPVHAQSAHGVVSLPVTVQVVHNVCPCPAYVRL